MFFIHTVVLLAVIFCASATCTDTYAPLIQAWSQRQTDHFYYTDWNEISQIIPGRKGRHGYTAEGICCIILTSPTKGAVPLYRYYRGGDHFYTTNAKEIGTTIFRQRGSHGYISEGIAGYCYPTQKKGTVPLYRYWKASISDHFYTTNVNVIGTAKPGQRGNNGYVSEGITCYVLEYKHIPWKHIL